MIQTRKALSIHLYKYEFEHWGTGMDRNMGYWAGTWIWQRGEPATNSEWVGYILKSGG
jgi:hypothetical protein